MRAAREVVMDLMGIVVAEACGRRRARHMDGHGTCMLARCLEIEIDTQRGSRVRHLYIHLSMNDTQRGSRVRTFFLTRKNIARQYIRRKRVFFYTTQSAR